MIGKTLTRMDLTEAIYRDVGVSRGEAQNYVESVLLHVSDALVRGEDVKISGFGTFSVRDKKERIGRNPKTGDTAIIEPRRVISFRPSHLFKDKIVSAGRKSK